MAVTPCSLPFFRRHILLATLTTTATTNPSSTSGASPEVGVHSPQTRRIIESRDRKKQTEFENERKYPQGLAEDDLSHRPDSERKDERDGKEQKSSRKIQKIDYSQERELRGKQQTDVVGDTSDLESDIFDEFDEEWQFYMNLIRDDLQRKTKELSYYIGKSIGPQVFVAMLTVAGFSFHLRFPYHVKLRTRETNLMRKLLSLFAEKYVI